LEHRDVELYFCSGAGLRILLHIVEIALLASRRPFTLHYEPEVAFNSLDCIPS